MQIKNLSLAILISLFSFSFILAQQPVKEYLFEVHGKVVDAEKVPYGAMSLNFEGEKFRGAVSSNEDGKFSIKLPAGKFKITTQEVNSSTFAAFIEISEIGPNPANFDLIITLNKNWCTNCPEGEGPEVIKYITPPSYPPTALAVGVRGEVVVKITINKEGRVLLAAAISGHPLLRSVSAQAARGWIFSPNDILEEREAKLVFAFGGCGKDLKETIGLFRKPNRLEIFSDCPVLQTVRAH